MNHKYDNLIDDNYTENNMILEDINNIKIENKNISNNKEELVTR